MANAEKTAAEIAAEERELAIKRGDIIPEDEPDEAVEASAEGEADDDGPGEVPEGEGDGEPKAEASAEAESGDEAGLEAAPTESGSEGDSAGEEEKPIMIPKARFDEAAQKARDKYAALEAKLKKAEQEHIVTQTDADIEKMQTEIDDLENTYEEHLLEGEVEKARAARKAMNAKRDELINRRLVQQSQQTGNAAVEQIRYETKLAMFEEKYPAINPDHDAFDQDVMEEVSELKAAFEARGWGSTAALERAIRYVPALRQQDVESDTPAPDPGIKRDQRAHKARKAVAAAAQQSPPDATRAGRDSDKGGKGDGLPDVSKMSPDQFDKWAEANPSEMAKLRGDILSTGDAA